MFFDETFYSKTHSKFLIEEKIARNEHLKYSGVWKLSRSQHLGAQDDPPATKSMPGI